MARARLRFTSGPRLRAGGCFALWLTLTLRFGLGLVALLGVHLRGVDVVSGDWLNLLIKGGEPWSELLSTWQRWDALWYQQIALHGYTAGDGTAAFYPLYPVLARLTADALGVHIVLGELIVSTLALVAAIWLYYLVARLDAGPLAARVAILATVLFPTGFFLLAPYTESVYLALSLAAFWFARTDRPWAAGLAGLGAGLTRVQGALLVLPLAFEHLRRRGDRGQGPDLALAAATLPPLGSIAWSAYLRLVVGESQTGLAAQDRWGYRIVPPWQALAESWAHLVGKGDLVEGLNLICLIGFALLALVALRRLPLVYSLYVWPYLAVLATRVEFFQPLMSVSRYTLVLFPCFLVVGMFLARRPWLAASWLIISLLLEALLLDFWVHFNFVA